MVLSTKRVGKSRLKEGAVTFLEEGGNAKIFRLPKPSPSLSEPLTAVNAKERQLLHFAVTAMNGSDEEGEGPRFTGVQEPEKFSVPHSPQNMTGIRLMEFYV